jgi:hypothetical protein
LEFDIRPAGTLEIGGEIWRLAGLRIRSVASRTGSEA